MRKNWKNNVWFRRLFKANVISDWQDRIDFDDPDSVDNYFEYMAKPRSWGTVIEQVIVTMIYDIDIHTLLPSYSPDRFCSFTWKMIRIYEKNFKNPNMCYILLMSFVEIDIL